MTPGGIRVRRLPQAWSPAAGTAHTGRQLRGVSVLAPLKALISTHPGRAAGLREIPHGRPQAPARPVTTTARKRGINHALGNTWPSDTAIRTRRKTLIHPRSGVIRAAAGANQGGNQKYDQAPFEKLAARRGGAGTIAVTLLSATISTGASASPAVRHAMRPHAVRVHKPAASKALRNGSNSAILPTAFSQQFTFNTNGFCTGAPNAPCDGNGAAGDYGTLDRVPSHFSNGGFGNYAPSTTALFKGYFALTDGTGVGNQGAGCPGTTATVNPGEACTGPFALFGTAPNQGADNAFPANGFTVTRRPVPVAEYRWPGRLARG